MLYVYPIGIVSISAWGSCGMASRNTEDLKRLACSGSCLNRIFGRLLGSYWRGTPRGSMQTCCWNLVNKLDEVLFFSPVAKNSTF